MEITDIGNEVWLEQMLYNPTGLIMNASILKTSEGYVCSYRTGHMDDCDPGNYIVNLNLDFAPISHHKMTSSDNNSAFEDVRLFEFGGEPWVIYTHLPKKGTSWEWKYTMGLGKLDTRTGQIFSQKSLREFSKRDHEKNWTPYVHRGKLYLITDFDPIFRVLVLKNPSKMEFTEIVCSPRKRINWPYGEIRGGTPFINRSNSVWKYSFFHSSVYLPNGLGFSKFYFSAPMRMNADTFEIQIGSGGVSVSKPESSNEYTDAWTLGTRGRFERVVFACGIINYSDGIVLSFGQDDCVSRLKYYSWDKIDSFFLENALPDRFTYVNKFSF